MKGLQLVRASSGKVGTVMSGPKQFLNTDILLGEIAVCIARETKPHASPSIWIIGAINLIDDYLYHAKGESLISETDFAIIVKRIESVTKIVPSSLERLSSVMGILPDDLRDMCKIAQVVVSAPIQGVLDHSSGKPHWCMKIVGVD
jgi:hypothetical protein